MMKIILFLFLGCVCFLYTLNLFLRGAKKQIIEVILGLLIVVTVIASFFLIGWRWGIVTLISPLVLSILFQPLAQAAAHKMLGYRTGIDDQLESFDEMVQQSRVRHQQLYTLASKSAISSVLQRHNVSFDEFENLFVSLWTSALHDLAWDIVSVPEDLDSLIQMKRQGLSDEQIWSHFRDFTEPWQGEIRMSDTNRPHNGLRTFAEESFELAHAFVAFHKWMNKKAGGFLGMFRKIDVNEIDEKARDIRAKIDALQERITVACCTHDPSDFASGLQAYAAALCQSADLLTQKTDLMLQLSRNPRSVNWPQFKSVANEEERAWERCRETGDRLTLMYHAMSLGDTVDA